MYTLIIVDKAAPIIIDSSESVQHHGSNHISYKSWSLNSLAFLRTLYQALFGLALPNYLIYQQILSEELIGIIIGTASLCYIVTPFLGQYLAKKMGTRKSIIFSTSLSAFAILMQVIFFEWGAPLLIVMQILEAIALGSFWPNLMNRISVWQKISDEPTNHRNFQRFNLSWNMGILGGYVIGFLVVEQFGNDFIAMITACGLVVLLIPIAFFLEDDAKFHTPTTLTIAASTEKQPVDPPQKSSHFQHLWFPIILAWALNIFYTTGKSLYNFNLPFNLVENNIESSWRYLIAFAQQMLQIIGLNIVGPLSVKSKNRIIKTMLLCDLGWALVMALSNNIMILISGVIFLGLSTGLKQGVVMRINFDYSSAKGTQKYITIGEIVAGIGFGITPLWLGWIVKINFHISYWIYLGFSLLIIGFYFWKTYKLTKKRK